MSWAWKPSGNVSSPTGRSWRVESASQMSGVDGVVAKTWRVTAWSGVWLTSRSGGARRCRRSRCAGIAASAAGMSGAKTQRPRPSRARSCLARVAPDEETPQLDLAAVLEAHGHHQAAERLLREHVSNRSTTKTTSGLICPPEPNTSSTIADGSPAKEPRLPRNATDARSARLGTGVPQHPCRLGPVEREDGGHVAD